MTGARIQTDPAYERTRENNKEFATAGKAGKLLRDSVRSLVMKAKDGKLSNRLLKEMMKVIKADATNPRGQRTVHDGAPGLLEGFDFNQNSPLNQSFHGAFTGIIDRATGKLTITIPAYVPTDAVIAPPSATHYKLVAAGVQVDFVAGKSFGEEKGSAILPVNSDPTAPLVIETSVVAGATVPLFLFFGIQFYQDVNGHHYSLKSGEFNALCIVKVDA